ncbi:MAG: lytic murein transglycosylase B [Gammaproteobacteria bacterium]
MTRPLPLTLTGPDQTSFRFFIFIVLLVLVVPARAIDIERADVRAFILELQRDHGFDNGQLAGWLSQAESKPGIIELISRPAEKVKPWHEYRQIFLGDERIRRGKEFYRNNLAAILSAADTSGVDAEIIAAIIGVETYYGDRPGKNRIIDALSTLAFDYPPRQKFFRRELAKFFELARAQGMDPLTPVGSYAGAMGMPQFMPSSYLAYAEDGDGDGKKDIWENIADVTASVGHYLVHHGWKSETTIAVPAQVPAAMTAAAPGKALGLDTSVGQLRAQGVHFDSGQMDEQTPAVLIQLESENGPVFWVGFANFHAITRYNRSRMYAMAVFELASEIKKRQPADSE